MPSRRETEKVLKQLLETASATDLAQRAAAIEAAVRRRAGEAGEGRGGGASRTTLLETAHDEVTYRLQEIRCGRACRCQEGYLHGPYWYGFWRSANGRMRSVYIGKKLRRLERGEAEKVKEDLAEARRDGG